MSTIPTFQQSSDLTEEMPALEAMDDIDNTEHRLRLAVEAILNSPLDKNGTHSLKIRAASRLYNVKRGTLTSHLNGVPTKKEAHAARRILTDAQEDVLTDWAKTMGHRGFPVTPDTLAEYASNIAGQKVGINWPRKFLDRHPDLKIKKTAPLEQCRAQALNRAVVSEFYSMLGDLINQYEITPENLYNSDEKGIQLGIGKSVGAIVDRNQKNVQQVENGNREMVTIIETAFKSSTIISAFIKSGIWPLNPLAIPSEAYEPATNTTTQAAMPVPTTLTPLLEVVEDGTEFTQVSQMNTTHMEVESTTTTISPPISLTFSPSPSAASNTSYTSTTSKSSQQYRLVGVPPKLPHTASRTDLRDQNNQLRILLEQVQEQLERDHTIKEVMIKENERLRQTLYHKELTKKRTYSSSNPRHMTSIENLDALWKAELQAYWKALFKEAGKTFRLCRKRIEEAEREEAKEVKRAEQERMRLEREVKKEQKKREQAADRDRKRKEHEAMAEKREAEREAAKKAEKAVKEAEREAKKAMKEAEKHRETRGSRGLGNAQGRARGRGRGRGVAEAPHNQIREALDAGDSSEEEHEHEFAKLLVFEDEWRILASVLDDTPSPKAQPKPRPIPMHRHAPLPSPILQPSNEVGSETVDLPEETTDILPVRRNPRRKMTVY
ncbi:hypothetical protein CVT25_012785 [Psilocybe cyanescens]|uniref:HTH CENPB-type domain-containing protein n=1 Tax=Psilocybe cyanescens TaxID=93625 RepID=A0A409X4F7_PSICY|nr:hypothetical protein CVT25_012785 [Psilocybe cyanescens]